MTPVPFPILLSLWPRGQAFRHLDGRGNDLILTPGRPALALGGDIRHPGRRSSAAASAAHGKPFEAHNRLFNLLALFAQFGEDLAYVHKNRPPSRLVSPFV